MITAKYDNLIMTFLIFGAVATISCEELKAKEVLSENNGKFFYLKNKLNNNILK
jgi:hypothetical protein